MSIQDFLNETETLKKKGARYEKMLCLLPKMDTISFESSKFPNSERFYVDINTEPEINSNMMRCLKYSIEEILLAINNELEKRERVISEITEIINKSKG